MRVRSRTRAARSGLSCAPRLSSRHTTYSRNGAIIRQPAHSNKQVQQAARRRQVSVRPIQCATHVLAPGTRGQCGISTRTAHIVPSCGCLPAISLQDPWTQCLNRNPSPPASRPSGRSAVLAAPSLAPEPRPAPRSPAARRLHPPCSRASRNCSARALTSATRSRSAVARSLASLPQ